MDVVKYCNFSFGVFISGFYCRDTRPPFNHLHLLETPVDGVHEEGKVRLKEGAINVPTFHTWGLLDKLVSPWRSEHLSRVCKGATVLPHPGDHFAKAIEAKT